MLPRPTVASLCLSLMTPVLVSCAMTGDRSPAVSSARVHPSAGYQPLSPTPVVWTEQQRPEAILEALPNESMRLAIGGKDLDGSLAYGPIASTVKNQTYTVVLDYIKFATTALPLRESAGRLEAELGRNPERAGPRHFEAVPLDLQAQGLTGPPIDLVLPVYVGVGLRLTADFVALEGGLDVANFFGLGLAAQAGKIRGSLHVQTLGISGEPISSAIPMPTEISVSSIQAAIQALATIKSRLYGDTVSLQTHVVGYESHPDFQLRSGDVSGVLLVEYARSVSNLIRPIHANVPVSGATE